jgi:glycosyltransferase involved in cell wall biosynthesis
MDKFQVAIVIPAFNEEDTISNVVQSVKKYGVVIVVNDASTDNTGQLAKEAGAVVVSHNENKGYDGALNSGFDKADQLNLDAVITFDADGQHSSNALPVYIGLLEEGIALVLGVRPKAQRFSESIFKIYTNNKYNWKDPLCGYKGYSMKLYRDRTCFDIHKSIGTELALYGIRSGYSYRQVDLDISQRSDKPRFSSVFGSNIKILRALFLIIVGKRD